MNGRVIKVIRVVRVARRTSPTSLAMLLRANSSNLVICFARYAKRGDASLEKVSTTLQKETTLNLTLMKLLWSVQSSEMLCRLT